MRKKQFISILCSALLLLSGCSLFENDMMVCEYKPLPEYLRYEIEYEGNTLKKFTVITIVDYSNTDQDSFEAYLKSYERKEKKDENTKGLDATIYVDQRIVTYSVEIDTAVYDVEADVSDLLLVEIKKEDFKDMDTLREKIASQRFQCDKLVE